MNKHEGKIRNIVCKGLRSNPTSTNVLDTKQYLMLSLKPWIFEEGRGLFVSKLD